MHIKYVLHKFTNIRSFEDMAFYSARGKESCRASKRFQGLSKKWLIPVFVMLNDTLVERIYKDAADLFLSVKLGKITKKVTLNEVVSRIEEHIIMDDADTTAILREMRDRPYDYWCNDRYLHSGKRPHPTKETDQRPALWGFPPVALKIERDLTEDRKRRIYSITFLWLHW